MDDLNCWHLCEELSILQAALLFAGQDPSGEYHDVERRYAQNRPNGYEAAKTAIVNGISKKLINGELSLDIKYDEYSNPYSETHELDLEKSYVSVVSLKKFLKKKGFTHGFFFPDEPEQPNYLNSENACYAPKLAAAVTAWEIVSNDKSKQKGKTPKQALEKWLREHANEYGLTDENGNPISAAIDQIAKVANWKPEGGAAKTPNLKEVSSNVTLLKNVQSIQEDISGLDDEIPF